MYELHVSPAANIVLQSAAHIRQQQAKQGYSQMHNVKQKPQYNVTENIYVSNIAYAFFRRAAGIPPAREKIPMQKLLSRNFKMPNYYHIYELIINNEDCAFSITN